MDRPGVPSELYDRYWIALGSVGQLGTTARIDLGRSEAVLGADAGLVASYAVVHDDVVGSTDAIVGSDGVTIIVREVRTGDIRRKFVTRVLPAHGVMVGARLFWWGWGAALKTDPPDLDRGAIWAIDLADAGSQPRKVVPALSEQFGQGWARSPLYVSDGGRVVMSSAAPSMQTAAATQVIDVATMSLRMTIHDEIAYELVGNIALVRRSEDRVGLLDLTTGRKVGPPLDVFIVQGTFAGTREMYVQHGRVDGTGVDISAIPLDSGKSRTLLHQGSGVITSFLNSELSTADILVLFERDPDFGGDGSPYVPISLLNPQTGDLQPEAFVIGTP